MEKSETKNAIDLGLQKLQALRDILAPHEIDIINVTNIVTNPPNAVFSKEPINSNVEMEVKLRFFSPNPSEFEQIADKSQK